MWFFLPCGFYSAVWCAKPDRMEHSGANARPLFPNGAMMIRARSQEHLEYLVAVLASAVKKSDLVMEQLKADQVWEDGPIDSDSVLDWAYGFFPIVEQAGSDYQWRIFMEREFFACLMEHIANEIDYSNFKNKAKELEKEYATNPAYTAALSRVWGIMYGLQSNGGAPWTMLPPTPVLNQTVLPFPSEEDVQAKADWEDAQWWPIEEEE